MPAAERTIFRRRIIVEASANQVHAGVEDDFHHYEILLTHDGSVVTSVTAKSLRTPFVTCIEAGDQLALLEGHAITTRPTGLPDPHHQCTHMFELAVVAIGQAARGGRRQYDIAVPHRELGGVSSATLHRNGELVFDWALDGDLITGPCDYVGKNVRDLARWAETTCDDEALEAIRVLRRGIHVSSGRSVPQFMLANASEMPGVSGACYVFQPVRVARGLRDGDNRRDFSTGVGALLKDFKTEPHGDAL